MENIIWGIAISLIAGFLTGTFMWPMKVISVLKFEHYWFIGMLFGLLILPWTIVLLWAPEPFEAYKAVGVKTLLTANLLSVGFGLANVLYGICIVGIGAGLAGAILTSLGITVGVLIPMIFKGSGSFSEAPDIFSSAGIMVIAGVGVILVGVIFISIAGYWRDKYFEGDAQKTSSQKSRKFFSILILTIIAGILSSCFSFTFVYSQGPIIEEFKSRGATDLVSNVAVWAGALVGGALVNIIYPAILMTRKKNWGSLVKFSKETVMAAILGIQLVLGAIVMGQGMILLGALGASIGFGIQQSMQIIGNQTVGFVSGEWKSVPKSPKVMLFIGLGLVFIAIVILGLIQR